MSRIFFFTMRPRFFGQKKSKEILCLQIFEFNAVVILPPILNILLNFAPGTSPLLLSATGFI